MSRNHVSCAVDDRSGTDYQAPRVGRTRDEIIIEISPHHEDQREKFLLSITLYRKRFSSQAHLFLLISPSSLFIYSIDCSTKLKLKRMEIKEIAKKSEKQLSSNNPIHIFSL